VVTRVRLRDTASAVSENLDLVRSIYADWERGDFGHAAEWADADIEFVLAGGGPADGNWRGLDGLAEGFRDYLSAWEGFRARADEYRELDGGRVLVLTSLSGRGKTSGLDLGSTGERGATLFHVRERAVTRLVTYATSDSALADLGLEE
jgi:ketosteroid isomerase-like protein